MASFLTAHEVAERLNVSDRQVYALIERYELPAVRVGSRCIRVDPTALESWISSRAVSAQGE